MSESFTATDRAAVNLARARFLIAQIVEKCVRMSALRERREDAEEIERLALDAIAALTGGSDA